MRMAIEKLIKNHFCPQLAFEKLENFPVGPISTWSDSQKNF